MNKWIIISIAAVVVVIIIVIIIYFATSRIDPNAEYGIYEVNGDRYKCGDNDCSSYGRHSSCSAKDCRAIDGIYGGDKKDDDIVACASNIYSKPNWGFSDHTAAGSDSCFTSFIHTQKPACTAINGTWTEDETDKEWGTCTSSICPITKSKYTWVGATNPKSLGRVRISSTPAQCKQMGGIPNKDIASNELLWCQMGLAPRKV